MAGAIRELALYTMRYDFRIIDPADARVLIIEGQQRIFGGFNEKLSQKAKESLEKMGVEVRLGCQVSDIQARFCHGETGRREG